jgi:hypothetical protein
MKAICDLLFLRMQKIKIIIITPLFSSENFINKKKIETYSLPENLRKII